MFSAILDAPAAVATIATRFSSPMGLTPPRTVRLAPGPIIRAGANKECSLRMDSGTLANKAIGGMGLPIAAEPQWEEWRLFVRHWQQ
jgi:hypothetical protein